MALRPANEDQVYHAVDGVRVYLDDLADLVANLAPYGTVELETTHKDGERSLADGVDDLAGRTDLWNVTVGLIDHSEDPPLRPLQVDAGIAVSYNVDQARADIRRVADHFLKTLEPARRPWWKRFRRADGPYVELILERRRSVKEAKAKKRHDYRLSLISGVAGALLGSLGTLLVALWGK